jgi:hypothetical protein
MNVTAVGLQAAKWMRAPAFSSPSIPAPTPTPTQKSEGVPPQVGQSDAGVPALVSSATQHALLMATQANESAPAQEHTPPAQQARAAILENPDLENRPFGAIVSQFARGETPELDAPTGSSSDTPPADAESQPDQDEIAITPPPLDPDSLIDEALSALV